MKIFYSTKFEREYRRLPETIKIEAEKKEKIFRENPHDRRLKTHKLKGKFREFWSFSITQKYRVVFKFGSNNTVDFHSVGDHDVYQ